MSLEVTDYKSMLKRISISNSLEELALVEISMINCYRNNILTDNELSKLDMHLCDRKDFIKGILRD